MKKDELLDRFPKLVLGSIRQQMLLGTIPAEKVRSILEPILENCWDLIVQLPPDLQEDLENILRIYSDVAGDFGLKMRPPISKVLPLLAQFLEKRASTPGAPDSTELDFAAERQESLYESWPGKFEGQGFFRTDDGSSVFLEFAFGEGADSIVFSRRPALKGVEIKIGGKSVLVFEPGQSEKIIGIGEFLELRKSWILP